MAPREGSLYFCSNSNMSMRELLKRYNKPIPRYTSYPPVPCWDSTPPTSEAWFRDVNDSWNRGNHQLSLYIHLLFCESLCTYCACNTRITTDHSVEGPYIHRLLKEWSFYLEAIKETPIINELHLGGGTPTFFSAQNLDNLLNGILSTAQLTSNVVMSFEAHPANTTSAHLQVLYKNGFRRMSLGIQDFDPRVQKLINRKQSEVQVRSITNLARIMGFDSINYDLIYGLPGQTCETMEETIRKVVSMRPDRIAFYGYAHVPSMRPAQISYEQHIPSAEVRSELYLIGREMLVNAGYQEVGLDHFALQGDALIVSAASGKLHRNFMGYTEHQSELLIGLGSSAISDTGTMLVQNNHKLEQWNAAIDAGELPIVKGHVMTAEDIVLKQIIFEIMCNGETTWGGNREVQYLDSVIERLSEFHENEMIRLEQNHLKVLDKGRPFLRHIAYCFDAHSAVEKGGKLLYSRP